MSRPTVKDTLHPRNRFRAGYDFPQLVASSPGLARFVGPNPFGDTSIDFANPDAVKALNQALLRSAYGLAAWAVPAGYLCPPIPSRSDYLHHLKDLLDLDGAGAAGAAATVLDIGAGANAIYPLIGAREYGWRFVATEVDPVALRSAQQNVAAHAAVAGLIECRLQTLPAECFAGVVAPGETFDLSMCNPPFHASAKEAAEGNRRKRRHLGTTARAGATLNFGGTGGELWCEGGAVAFTDRMIAQSAARPGLCRWFTTLVSKGEHLPGFYDRLEDVDVADVQTLEMAHGQKRSRILAWTFARLSDRRGRGPS